MKKSQSFFKQHPLFLPVISIAIGFVCIFIIAKAVNDRNKRYSTESQAAGNITAQALVDFATKGVGKAPIVDKATGNTFQLNYKLMGKEGKKTIVLAAGLGAGVSSWIILQPVLSLNYRVLSYDPRCLYESECPVGLDENYAFSAWNDDLEQLLAYLNIDTVDALVGWSMGGIIVPPFCADHPDICQRVIILASAPMGPLNQYPQLQHFSTEMQCKEGTLPPDADWEDMKVITDTNIVLSFNNPLLANVAKLANQMMMGEDYFKGVLQQYRVLQQPETENYGSLARLTSPALVLHGTNDRLVSHTDICTTEKDTQGNDCPSYQQTSCNAPRLICDRITGTRKSAAWIKDGSHSVAMENFAKVAFEIQKFLLTPKLLLFGNCSVFSPGN